MEVINSIGRRKTSVARIYISPGTGQFNVNNRALTDYFSSSILQFIAQQALTLTQSTNQFNVKVHVNGGGIKGQAEAIRLGLSRALVKINADENKSLLKKEGLLTRDSRMVERKKPGRRKARRRFQFSKR